MTGLYVIEWSQIAHVKCCSSSFFVSCQCKHRTSPTFFNQAELLSPSMMTFWHPMTHDIPSHGPGVGRFCASKPALRRWSRRASSSWKRRSWRSQSRRHRGSRGELLVAAMERWCVKLPSMDDKLWI